MKSRRYRLGVCPECGPKEGDYSRKRLYQCSFCERWLCKKHLEPRLAHFGPIPTHLVVPSPEDRAWQALLAEAKEKEGSSHPDFQYTETRWRFLLEEERRKSEAISRFLDKFPSVPKWLIPTSQRRKRERPPTKEAPHIIRRKRTSVVGALKVMAVCCIFLVLGGAVYFNWDRIATWKFPNIPLPDLSDTLPSQEVDIAAVESGIFAYINDERTSQGLPRLQEDSNLLIIASQWSEHLATSGQVTHGNFEERIAGIGYSYYLCGEIIAMYGGWHSNLARQFVDMWMGSPGHYEIMITPSSGYMGVGVSEGVDGFYAVVDFRFN